MRLAMEILDAALVTFGRFLRRLVGAILTDDYAAHRDRILARHFGREHL